MMASFANWGEVLLLEAQFCLTDLGGVFRVENLGDVLGA